MATSHCASSTHDTPPLSSLMTTKQVMSMVGIHQNTLYNHVKRGTLQPYRIGDNGNLRWSEGQIRELFNVPIPKGKQEGKKIAILARVSTTGQKLHLKRQIDKLKEYVRDTFNDDDPLIFSNICSSFGDRKELYNIIFRIIEQGDISHIVYAYRDRLSRVACLTNLIKVICQKYNVELVQVEKTESENLIDESYSELIEMVTVLSCRANGRKSKATCSVPISDDVFKRIYCQ